MTQIIVESLIWLTLFIFCHSARTVNSSFLEDCISFAGVTLPVGIISLFLIAMLVVRIFCGLYFMAAAAVLVLFQIVVTVFIRRKVGV